MSTLDHLYKLRAMPEIEHKEFKTSAYIADRLEEFGYEVIRGVGGTTGVIGILDSGIPGKTVGIRADMDALPFDENGKIVMKHACGHDANCSIGLEAARLIKEDGIAKGRFFSVFQPAEEGTGGALSVVNSGLVDDLDELIGVHLLNNDEEKGPVGAICPALHHCGAAQVHAVYHGRSAHGSKPWEGINAFEAVLLAANGLALIHGPVDKRWSVKTTKVNTGAGGINTIPDTVEIGIDVRCDDNREMEILLSKIGNVINKAGETVGATTELDPLWFNPASENSTELTDTVKEVIKEVLGEEFLTEEIHSSGAEDFVEFNKIPGIKTVYIALNGHVINGLHHAEMSYDDSVLDGVAEVLKSFVIKRLNY